MMNDDYSTGRVRCAIVEANASRASRARSRVSRAGGAGFHSAACRRISELSARGRFLVAS